MKPRASAPPLAAEPETSTGSATATRAVQAPDATDLLARALRDLGDRGADALEAMALVGEAVRAARAGASMPSVIDSLHTAAARPALELLRRRILFEADSAGDQEAFAESHALCVALERVHDHLCRDDIYRVVDQLAGGTALDLLVEVAHDMRSPLGSILFLVDRVRSGQSGPVSEAQARQLGLAYSAAFGLSALASDVMELARGSGRLMGPEPVPFTLSEVFRTVDDMVRPVAAEKGLVLHMVAPPRDVRLGHPVALARVLLNLATNACKFTAQGSVTVQARARDGGRVEFRVLDTGRGVPPNVAAQLFDTFRPRAGGGAAGGVQAFSSAGLGLAICRKLVAAMGGELALQPARSPRTVGSDPVESGACFHYTLHLPRSNAHLGS